MITYNVVYHVKINYYQEYSFHAYEVADLYNNNAWKEAKKMYDEFGGQLTREYEKIYSTQTYVNGCFI